MVILEEDKVGRVSSMEIKEEKLGEKELIPDPSELRLIIYKEYNKKKEMLKKATIEMDSKNLSMDQYILSEFISRGKAVLLKQKRTKGSANFFKSKNKRKGKK